jgi:hypothetical protein
MEEIRENGEIIILVPQTYINIDQKSFDDDDDDSLGYLNLCLTAFDVCSLKTTKK